MTLQPFAVADATLDWFRRYVRASFPLRDSVLDEQREMLIDQGLLWAPTYIKLERPGKTGPALESLRGMVLDRTLDLPWGFTDLYDHQAKAIARLAPPAPEEPKNTLVLSGTGSGKTESFLIPIVDACLRADQPGIKAVVIYPMNALANDQLKRLRELLADCPEVSVGRYTGDTPEVDAGDPRRPGRPVDVPPNVRWSRQAMRDEPPDILLTNYSMLEYLLLRRKDEELFRFGAPRFLVVDEIHLFTGVLGAEVASLLRRFRQHVAGVELDICMIGTSATAGNEAEEEELARFAARFFGAPFGKDALVTEALAPLGVLAGELPPAPEISPALLRESTSPAGLAALARATFGLELPSDESLPEALGEAIDRFGTVGVVERALAKPAAVEDAARALGQLPERAGVDEVALLREVQAILLLGAAAKVASVGEEIPEPRFRPRLHQVLRSPAGLWRCLDPMHGSLVRPDEGRCSCAAMTLPLASCRTCGEAYWSSQARTEDLDQITRVYDVDVQRDVPSVFLADPDRLGELVTEDEDGNKVTWTRRRLCPWCGIVTTEGTELDHDRRCSKPFSDGVVLVASTDDVHCPACGDLGARNRPIILPLKGSAAASTAVVTQGLSDELRAATDEAGGRLLVFADSRQNAAQQAGYAADQGARIAVRQLVARALSTGGTLSLRKLPAAVSDLVMSDPEARRRWLVGESERNFTEVSHPEYVMSDEDRARIEYQLSWEIALETTERARRRFSLEREGVVVLEIDGLAKLVESISAGWPTCPFTDTQLREVTQGTVDVMRYGRAVSHQFLKRDPRSLVRNHGIRIGDPAINQTRGYGPKKFSSRKDGIDIRAWTDAKYTTRLTELVGRVLGKKPVEVNDVVETLVERLQAVGLLTGANIDGKKRFMLDQDRLLFHLHGEEPLWRCDRCGMVRGSILHALSGSPLCIGWRCKGTPQRFEPLEERDFYARQYLTDPRRFIVREHSGQIEGDVRLELEARFNDREHPIIDALAATPTLEVGVSLDDLHAVVLRNIPPTPANYAQRVGRAGRRSKVGLAITHAGHGPHDGYYFERPGEMIAGLVRAPAISLDNEPLLRRHMNSLILEVLGLDLPMKWVPDPEESAEEQQVIPTIADEGGVIRETTLAPFEEALVDPTVRARIEAAVKGAFASPSDPEPPAHAEEIALDQLDHFLEELRAALMRWTERFRALLEEFKKSQARPGLPSKQEKEYIDRIYREISRMANPATPEQQPLGFLGIVGFLPRYGFTGHSVLLHARGSDQPLVQSASVAVTEYAPGNLVYARGRRLKVDRFDPAPVEEAAVGPEHRENVLSVARRCDSCEYLTEEPLEKACPECGKDLISQPVLHLTGVSGGGRQISSEDEYRRRSDYAVRHILGPAPQSASVVELAGYRIDWSRGRTITVANTGRTLEADAAAQGFEVCTSCGLGAEYKPVTDDDQEGRSGHRAFCPAVKDPDHQVVKRKVWLTARMQGDVFEMELPLGARGATFSSWRASLAEALLLGIRETMQAGRRDLDWFERRRKGEPVSLVFFDTMPGGTGYLPKLFQSEAEGLKAAAEESLTRLLGCSCTGSCHRCLRDFWNQRMHEQLNRFEVLTSLKRLAGADVVEGIDPDDEKLESFLEKEFYERLEAAGVPRPTLQVVRVLGGHRIIRVDCEYRDPDVSVFLDGRAYHAQSVDKIADDLEIRNRLEASGVFVLEFTYADVMERFDKVSELVQLARSRGTETLALGALPGLIILDQDEATKRVVASVDPAAWVGNEAARQAALESSNKVRAAGYRLKRVIGS